MYAGPAAVDSRVRGNDEKRRQCWKLSTWEEGVGVALVLVVHLGSDSADSVKRRLSRNLVAAAPSDETRVSSQEGLDYGRWSSRQRSRVGTYGNPRGGADALLQVRRRIVPPWRPQAGRGGDQGCHRPLRHRGRRSAALHLRHSSAGRSRADPIPPGQLPRRTPFLADNGDPEPGVRFWSEERDAR